MSSLSGRALSILERMEPGCGYGASELRAFAPDLNIEALRDVMHELWIARHVERFGDCGWRRTLSTGGPPDTQRTGDGPSLRIGEVRPEELFDHGSFAGWFK